MYASIGTRPNISFAVNTLAQHASAPGEPHLQALKCIFRYLAGTKDYHLIFNGRSEEGDQANAQVIVPCFENSNVL
jgi:hypothetical protein